VPSDFPGSPKILKGALVAYQPPEPLPTIVVFQYNPKELSRSLSGRAPSGGGQGDAQRTDGPPEESISVSVEIDAADQLEQPLQNPTTVAFGLHPALAALEGLMYPPHPTVIANQALALAGSAAILSEPAPLVFFIWGPSRILPVRVESITIREKEYDQLLNPILAEADLSLQVLTYRDLEPTNPGYWVYLSAFAKKEVMAALYLNARTSAAIQELLPL
jgi:hypothetical protein